MGTHETVEAAPGVGAEGVPPHSHEEETVGFAVELGHRIRTMRGKRSRQDLADAVGVHVNTLGKFERGESMPDALLIRRLCSVTGRAIEWLITGEDDGGMDPPKSVIAVERGKYLFVPLFDVQASAGPGAFVDVERVVAMRPFDINYIRGELRIPHNHVALLGVNGSSSEPVLRSGDTVMVDRKDQEVYAEGLHLLRFNDALLVKNVQRLPGQTLRVSSPNNVFQAFDIPIHAEAESDVVILGRVRWGGVTFR